MIRLLVLLIGGGCYAQSLECVKQWTLPAYPPIAVAARVQGEIRAKVAVRPDGTGSVEVEGPVMLQGSVKSVLERAQLDPACGGRIFTLFVTFEISKIVPEGQTLLKETLWVAPNRLIIRSEAPDLKPQP